MKTKERTAYRCGECGQSAAKWVGRCPECQAWGSVVEATATMRGSLRAVRAGPVRRQAQRMADVPIEAARAQRTGVGELDRVLGGGIVPGSVVLLAGEPGVGKSTLLLDVAQRFTAGGLGPALVVTGEESPSQVRLRAERMGALHPELYLASETDLAAVLSHVEDVAPRLMVIDSIQTIATDTAEGTAGGVTQVRAVAGALIALAKERGIATLLVGHVTKDGAIAGPRVLEHLVDVVLQFEGERHTTLRLLRGVKNRYGPADEVGCFELHESGIEGLADPSGLFRTDRCQPVPGTCLAVVVEGRRPILTELQALTAKSSTANPRRAFSGLDSARMAMVLAVLERRAGIRIGELDVYTSTVGGIRVTEPAADLAAAVSIASAVRDQPMASGLVAIGEVGLVGEIRQVSGVRQRLAEAARMGCSAALVPSGQGERIDGLHTVEVKDLGAAVAHARMH